MDLKINQSHLDHLITTFHASIAALKNSILISMDEATTYIKGNSDSIKDFALNNEIVLIIKINKFYIYICKSMQKKYLIIKGNILSEAINKHKFRPFKIFIVDFVEYLKNNMIVSKNYIFTNLKPKLCKNNVEHTKELVFKASKSTQSIHVCIILIYIVF